MTKNPFNAKATAILRPLCQALYFANLADVKMGGDGEVIPHQIASTTFAHIHSAIDSMIDLIFPATVGATARKFINYGGNEDFFCDFCQAVNDALSEFSEKDNAEDEDNMPMHEYMDMVN